MRLHFLISISVVLTHPGLRKEQNTHLTDGYHHPPHPHPAEQKWCLWTAHHRPVDIPEGSLLAVQDLPLDFIFLPVDPAEEISRCEECCSLAVISAL